MQEKRFSPVFSLPEIQLLLAKADHVDVKTVKFHHIVVSSMARAGVKQHP